MTEVVLHEANRLDSKIRSRNVHFHDSFWRENKIGNKRTVFVINSHRFRRMRF